MAFCTSTDSDQKCFELLLKAMFGGMKFPVVAKVMPVDKITILQQEALQCELIEISQWLKHGQAGL